MGRRPGTLTKVHRFIGNWQLAHGNVRLDDRDLVHQMHSAFKLRPGDPVVLGDGTGREAQCTILSFDRDAVVVSCTAIGRNANEPQMHLILYCAILKAEHFQEAAAMATQVGARQLVPVITARTVKMGLRLDRVRRVVREAAELSGRGVIPAVGEPLSLDKAFTDASRNDANLFLDPTGKEFSGLGAGNRRVGVFIGPEGGWEAGEVARAREYGMRIIGLGPLVLRAETAAVVATYLTLHALRNR